MLENFAEIGTGVVPRSFACGESFCVLGRGKGDGFFVLSEGTSLATCELEGGICGGNFSRRCKIIIVFFVLLF